MNMREVLKNELDLILLSQEEILKFRGIANVLIKKLKQKGLRAFIGGSMAKGTMVRKTGRQDVDIFVVFEYSEDILRLEKVLKSIDLPGKLKKVHGSRDYFHVVCEDVVLEVVPVVENKDPELAENVTDMSLSHVSYVRDAINKDPELAGEICLAKAFCRANRCYGAEGYVRGFSGYSLEILVIYFGGFVKLLKGLRKKRVVDSCKYFRNELEVKRELNASKLQGPLIVIDPTYKFRNVCAGLGFETFEKFLKVSEKFLKKPSLEYFEKKDLDVLELEKFAEKKKARFLKLKFFTDRQSGDIAGTKMRKLGRFFVRELERNGQEVLRFEFDYDGKGQEAFGYLAVKENEMVDARGPKVGLQEQARKFREAKGEVFKKKGFWWSKKKVCVEEVLDFVKRFEGEMGARIRRI